MQKYSFLMSVYYKESPDYLRQSIESMLYQTVKPDEIIIIKDGPLSKELDEIIEKYNNDSDLFTVIALEKNVGLGNALNVGLKASKNELVARMDSDDICFHDRCEKMLKKFETNSNLVVLGGQIKEFCGSTENIVSYRIVPTEYNDILKFARRRSPFNHPSVMYKKSIILKEGGYPSSGRKEDLDLFLSLLSKGYYVENLNDFLLYYRADSSNFSRRRSWKNCKEYICVIKKYWKSGFCHFSDFVFVCVAQLAFFLLPTWLLKGVNRRFLRKSI